MDIFDEMIQCLKNETDRYGNVFVNRDNLTEFFTDAASRPAPAPVRDRQDQSVPAAPQDQMARPAPRPSPPGRMPASRPAPSMQDRQSAAMEADFHTETLKRNVPLDPAAVSKMDWEQLRHAAFNCHACRLCETRTNVVFSDGYEHADLMFIGEGPGADEDAQGIPFVGKAGQLLTKMIAAMQFKREEVYIANIVKCRPPGNRNPTDDEMAACIPYLLRQIELVSPKVIVLLGSVALKGLLNRSGIMRMRGHWLDYRGIMVMPTFHPAYLLRYEAGKKDAWSDLQQVMKVFGKVYSKPQGR